MKHSTIALAATAICAVQAASIHRRHEHHKRHDNGQHQDYVGAVDLQSLQKQNLKRDHQKRHDNGQHQDYVGAVDLQSLNKNQKREVYDNSASGSDNTENFESKPAYDEVCKQVKIGKWVPVSKRGYEATPTPPPQEYKSQAPVPASTPANQPYGQPSPPPYEAPAPAPAPGKDQYQRKPHAPNHDSTPAPPSAPDRNRKGKGGHGRGGNRGTFYGMAYALFTDTSGCIPPEQMESDIANMAAKGIEVVRIYSTECDALTVIGNACRKHGMKMMVGTFIKSPDFSESNKDLDAIIAWGQWDLVVLVIVGNEAWFGRKVSSSALAGHVRASKQKLVSAGCNAPVTTAETTGSMTKEICDACDVGAVNVQAFFNEQNIGSKAGDFVVGQIGLTSEICGGKEVIVTEAGWPNGGASRADPGEQIAAMTSIKGVTSSHKIVAFSWNNAGWREAGVERHFGCKDVI